MVKGCTSEQHNHDAELIRQGLESFKNPTSSSSRIPRPLPHSSASHLAQRPDPIMKIPSLLSSLAFAAVAMAGGSMPSICDKYTTALLKQNTAANQQTLLTLVVNTAVIGNYVQQHLRPAPCSNKLTIRRRSPMSGSRSRAYWHLEPEPMPASTCSLISTACSYRQTLETEVITESASTSSTVEARRH